MGSVSSHTGSISKRKENNVINVLLNVIDNIYYSFLPADHFVAGSNDKTYNEMPESIWGFWTLAKILGIPVTFLSFLTALKVRLLDIDFNTIPNPYKNAMYFFSCVFIVFLIIEKYHKGTHYKEISRKAKIENDQLEWKNKKEREPVDKKQ